MAERRSSYDYEDLLACGRGELFGPGNAQLPLPPMLMFDRIAHISENQGAHDKGQVVAELAVAGNSRLGHSLSISSATKRSWSLSWMAVSMRTIQPTGPETRRCSSGGSTCCGFGTMN